MVKFLKDESGAAWAWVIVLVTIVVLALVWGTLGPVVQETHTYVNTTGEVLPEMQGPIDNILQVWRWFPVILLFGMILWALAYSVFRESGGY